MNAIKTWPTVHFIPGFGFGDLRPSFAHEENQIHISSPRSFPHQTDQEPRSFRRVARVCGDRSPRPDQAVDPAASRVGAPVLHEDHLPVFFMDRHETDFQGSPVERHLMSGIEKDRDVVIRHEPDVVDGRTGDGTDPEVRASFGVGGDRFLLPISIV